MKQQLFERLGQKRWDQMEQVLDALESRQEIDAPGFPHLYRRVCQDLSLARDRQFGGGLVERLNQLAIRGHRHLYRSTGARMSRIAGFVTRDFPRAVRAEWRLVSLGALLFYGVGGVVAGLVYANPDLIYSFMDAGSVANFEEMYRPGPSRNMGRGSDDDVMMFGYYIWNNISIAFRMFAGGLIFCIGAFVPLVFNGVYIGLVASHLTSLGYGETFYPFVVGHGAFELNAIVLAGVAGMRLGLALVAPGSRSRLQALRESGQRSMPIVYGTGGMLLVAAAIEAFWSPSTLISANTKYAVGAAFWGLVTFYFLAAGRGDAD